MLASTLLLAEPALSQAQLCSSLFSKAKSSTSTRSRNERDLFRLFEQTLDVSYIHEMIASGVKHEDLLLFLTSTVSRFDLANQSLFDSVQQLMQNKSMDPKKIQTVATGLQIMQSIPSFSVAYLNSAKRNAKADRLQIELISNSLQLYKMLRLAIVWAELEAPVAIAAAAGVESVPETSEPSFNFVVALVKKIEIKMKNLMETTGPL